MAWKLVEIADTEAGAEDFSDDEVVRIYLGLQNTVTRPYDDSNPDFTSYLKLSAAIKTALQRTEKNNDA
jgi:hypothetical protein